MDADKINPIKDQPHKCFLVLLFIGVYRRLIFLDFVTRAKQTARFVDIVAADLPGVLFLMSASVQRKLQQVHQRLATGDVAGAASLCEDVLRLAPRNPDALWLLATTHVLSGRPQEAVPLLEQVVAVVPNHGAALDSLGLAHLMLGQYAAAERPLRAAGALAGAPPSVRMRLGIALMHLGQHRDAIAQLQHVLSQEPANADARVNLGLAYGRAGDAPGRCARIRKTACASAESSARPLQPRSREPGARRFRARRIVVSKNARGCACVRGCADQSRRGVAKTGAPR